MVRRSTTFREVVGVLKSPTTYPFENILTRGKNLTFAGGASRKSYRSSTLLHITGRTTSQLESHLLGAMPLSVEEKAAAFSACISALAVALFSTQQTERLQRDRRPRMTRQALLSPLARGHELTAWRRLLEGGRNRDFTIALNFPKGLIFSKILPL